MRVASGCNITLLGDAQLIVEVNVAGGLGATHSVRHRIVITIERTFTAQNDCRAAPTCINAKR